MRVFFFVMAHGFEAGLGNSLSFGSARLQRSRDAILPARFSLRPLRGTHFCVSPAPGRFMEARLGLLADATRFRLHQKSRLLI